MSIEASNTASFTLQGRDDAFPSTAYGYSPPLLPFTTARTSNRFCLKNVIAMESILIIADMSDDELAVEVAVDIPDDIDMVAVADAEVDIVMPDMSIFDECEMSQPYKMDMGNVAWLTYPLALHGTRAFDCEDLTPDQCTWYKQRWHFWYIADWVFALPTIAFFMSAIGIFIIGHFISRVLRYRRFRGPAVWQKLIAAIRYLSYRGFHVRVLRWNSAPVGVLLLGLAGVAFFFCMDLIPQPYYWAESFYVRRQARQTGSHWSQESRMSDSKFSTDGSPTLSSSFHSFTRSRSLCTIFTGTLWKLTSHRVSCSTGPVLKLNYEFFKFMHFAAVIVFMVVLFWHCDYTLTSWDYFIATAAIYVPCYTYPWLRTLFEYGTRQKATLTIEENGFTRITIPANFTWTPGQHCFLRFTSFGITKAVSAHPFTICSLPSIHAGEKNELVFYIRHQHGFTKTLYEFALEHPGFGVGVMVDGPYGGVNMQKYYDGDHSLVVAGGSGAGWVLPFVERFVRDQFSNLTTTIDEEKALATAAEGREVLRQQHDGPTSLRVILATRDISSRIWFLRTVSEVLAKYPGSTRTKDINIQVFLTGEAAHQVDLSSSKKEDLGETSSNRSMSSDDCIAIPVKQDAGLGMTNVPGKEFEDRPRLAQIIHGEGARMAHEGRSMGVFVCGPETMQNDVRNAVAAENLQVVKGAKRGGVYLHSEHFSWA
ncbi:hypothetical protein BLS_005449 [Venturia inaequalis]|uniref:ferric-chelate reductase (NADPH) n=1 Tax=Venturia inaequalis TaxID=5025 RepID=A0A8H3UFV6_VENIN|nr:hypothetical protein BLS_005449 [Venturia inaequalis]